MMKHPTYLEFYSDWRKWRLAYVGGRAFINRYLQKFSEDETTENFRRRKAFSYSPSYAKAAINEIRDLLVPRLNQVSRVSEDQVYLSTIKGKLGGIDLKGSSLDSYIAKWILPELLVMGRVGVYVDMPVIDPQATLLTTAHPYIYIYPVESILNWCHDANGNLEQLALNANIFEYAGGFPVATVGCDRVYKREADGSISVTENGKTTYLNLPMIPFIMLELPYSLMTDVADMQIALLNMAASDIAYVMSSNVPLYTEQYDANSESPFIKDKPEAGDKEIKLGKGRAYPRGLERPGFIHPSPDPLRASMEKQQTIINDIRANVGLAVKNLTYANDASEPGLNTIGLELESFEQKLATLWAAYTSTQPATVSYPKDYVVLTAEAKEKSLANGFKLIEAVPSPTFRKEVTKQLATIAVGDELDQATIETIHEEIDKSAAIIPDSKDLAKDVELGLVSNDTASQIRGYPEGEAAKAANDHAERLARIAISQSKGIASGAEEKLASRSTLEDPTPTDKVRGGGKA